MFHEDELLAVLRMKCSGLVDSRQQFDLLPVHTQQSCNGSTRRSLSSHIVCPNERHGWEIKCSQSFVQNEDLFDESDFEIFNEAAAQFGFNESSNNALYGLRQEDLMTCRTTFVPKEVQEQILPPGGYFCLCQLLDLSKMPLAATKWSTGWLCWHSLFSFVY